MQDLTPDERETIIRYSYADDIAIVFTYDRALQNRLNKLVGVNSDIKVTQHGDDWTQYEVNKKWVKVRPPKKVNLTEEQRQAAADRMAKAREKRNI